MGQVKSGDTVKIHYTGRLDDGTVFDSSQDRGPLEFKLGEGYVIEGFEKGVEGMSPGESKTIKMTAEEAYGPRHSEMVQEVEIDQLPPEAKAEVGLELQLCLKEGGNKINFAVVEVKESTVILDGNHPLAGEDLTFDLELVEIV